MHIVRCRRRRRRRRRAARAYKNRERRTLHKEYPHIMILFYRHKHRTMALYLKSEFAL